MDGQQQMVVYGGPQEMVDQLGGHPSMTEVMVVDGHGPIQMDGPPTMAAILLLNNQWTTCKKQRQQLLLQPLPNHNLMTPQQKVLE